MKPIAFTCTQFIAAPPAEIAAGILDMERWKEFTGHGFLPGIKEARFAKRTPDLVGSRIEVENLDGSTHVEEIYKWIEGEEIGMRLGEFSKPLNKLASHFTEEWKFDIQGPKTQVSRSFELFPVSGFTRPFLWLISRFFRKAIDKHLVQMAAPYE